MSAPTRRQLPLWFRRCAQLYGMRWKIISSPERKVLGCAPVAMICTQCGATIGRFRYEVICGLPAGNGKINDAWPPERYTKRIPELKAEHANESLKRAKRACPRLPVRPA